MVLFAIGLQVNCIFISSVAFLLIFIFIFIVVAIIIIIIIIIVIIVIVQYTMQW